MSNPKTDPLIRAAKKARADSEVGKLEALASKLRYWQRRETIARNKVSEVRIEISAAAQRLASEVDQRQLRDEVLP